MIQSNQKMFSIILSCYSLKLDKKKKIIIKKLLLNNHHVYYVKNVIITFGSFRKTH